MSEYHNLWLGILPFIIIGWIALIEYIYKKNKKDDIQKTQSNFND